MKIDALKNVCDILLSAQNILLTAHKNPDGDAIGSTAALAVVLEKAGKNVSIIYPDKVAPRLEFILCGRTYQHPEARDTDFVPDIIISLDAAAASRLGVLENELAEKVDLSIDHHELCTPFAKYTVTDGKASAASEMVYEVATELAQRGAIKKIDSDIAYPMFAGIASDTGSFKYSNVSENTMNVAAKLIATGIDNAEISRLLVDTYSFNRLKANAITTENLELFAGGKAAIVTVDKDIFENMGLTLDDFDESVNLARNIAGVEVGAYIRPDKLGGFKASIRSNCYVDVTKIAAVFGGGGHLRAAGCSIHSDSLEAAKKELMKEIEKSLD